MLFNVLHNRSFEQSVTFLYRTGGFHNKGFGNFPLAVRRDADDDAVVYRGVGEQVGFQFGGGDLEAFYFD